MTTDVFIGLGGNLGDRRAHIERAIFEMSKLPSVEVAARAGLYDSAPFGPPQPRYLNTVVKLRSGLEPLALLQELKRIETLLGRVVTERWLPRPVDLDIVLWPGRVVHEARLQVPHPELPNRRFVLEPLCELAPLEVHPILGKTMKALLDALPPQDVHRLEGSS